jgi:hypothetical protein
MAGGVTATRIDTSGLSSANARRAAGAGGDAAKVARRILDGPHGAGLDEDQRALLAARADNPDSPWSAVADLAGLTKDQAIGRYRRIADRLAPADENHPSP